MVLVLGKEQEERIAAHLLECHPNEKGAPYIGCWRCEAWVLQQERNALMRSAYRLTTLLEDLVVGIEGDLDQAPPSPNVMRLARVLRDAYRDMHRPTAEQPRDSRDCDTAVDIQPRQASAR